MKREEILQSIYYDYARMDTGVDLTEAGLSLSDYNELYRVIRVISAHETAHTYSSNVKTWIEKHGVCVLESNGVYIFNLKESEV